MARILIIDDDPGMVQVISEICKEKGHESIACNSGAKAIERLGSVAPQLVICDMKMEKVTGFDVLKECREVLPQTPFVMITAYKTVETALEAMKLGAFDYIVKPFKIDELQITIQRALEFQSAVRENVYLKKELKERYRFENIIGTSDKMQEIYNLIAKIADTDSTILIQGESGTGKELVARALHFNSSRQHQPFVAINCSALPENLLESELFGHKKGAFTGAVVDKVGLFEEAQQGTIFLDEINSMPPLLQTKLLRVLQERQLRRVGDTKTIPINVRVLAATNESLLDKTKTGSFREDLYYRLAVIPLEMPALHERVEDIALLVNHFLQKNATQTGQEPKKIDPKAVEVLMGYRWPGQRPGTGKCDRAGMCLVRRRVDPRKRPAAACRAPIRVPGGQAIGVRTAGGTDARRIHSRPGKPLHRRNDQALQRHRARKPRRCSASAWPLFTARSRSKLQKPGPGHRQRRARS